MRDGEAATEVKRYREREVKVGVPRWGNREGG